MVTMVMTTQDASARSATRFPRRSGSFRRSVLRSPRVIAPRRASLRVAAFRDTEEIHDWRTKDMYVAHAPSRGFVALRSSLTVQSLSLTSSPFAIAGCSRSSRSSGTL